MISTLRQKARAGSEYFGSPGQADDGWYYQKAIKKPEYKDRPHLAFARFTDYTKLKKLNLVAEEIRSYSAQLSDVRVLDAGCGRGTYSLALASLGCTVFGVELDPELVNQSKDRDPKHTVDFRVGDAEEFAKSNKPFNVILALDVLEHMSQAKCASFCRTVYECLTSPGLFLVVVPSGWGLVELYARGTTLLQRMLGVLGAQIPHDQRFTLQKSKQMILAGGFRYKFVSSIYEGNLFTPLLLGRRRGQAAWLNMKLSDHLPRSMMGSWLIAGIKGR
ncbi:MAG: class I SAM-dependent methyltransferase [Chloroflexi bacterium]|nr:class I SAM-dependent methyltransferase [Chloroflexota bacterium]